MKIPRPPQLGLTSAFYHRELVLLTVLMLIGGTVSGAQTSSPPTAPYALQATVASCGEVDLSWGASIDQSGTGLKAYIINRSDNVDTTIGAVRTTFNDTNYVRSSSTLSYYVVAQDNGGNTSPPSNSVTVTTLACSLTAGEVIVDSAYTEPLGKGMALYNARSLLLYAKQNSSLTLDAWAYVYDANTGQSSRFLLHTAPSYHQIESDYVLTSTADLWTLSFNSYAGGNLLVSHYVLNGSPPTSASLVSTQALGDSHSYAKSMILLTDSKLRKEYSGILWRNCAACRRSVAKSGWQIRRLGSTSGERLRMQTCGLR